MTAKGAMERASILIHKTVRLVMELEKWFGLNTVALVREPVS